MDFNESKAAKVFKILAAISVAAVTVLGLAASPASASRDTVVESDILCRATDDSGNSHFIVIGSTVNTEQGCSGFEFHEGDGTAWLPFERAYDCATDGNGAYDFCETVVHNGWGVYTRHDVNGATDPDDCLLSYNGIYAVLGEECAY